MKRLNPIRARDTIEKVLLGLLAGNLALVCVSLYRERSTYSGPSNDELLARLEERQKEHHGRSS